MGTQGTTATDTAEAPEPDDDRIGAAGWWQLAALSAVGAVAPLVYFGLRSGPVPWTAVVVLGLALAVVLPASQVWSWSRRGGRAAGAATREWVTAGRVPSGVPDAVWRPRVQQFAEDVRWRRTGGWLLLGATVLWVVVALTGTAGDWGTVVIWAAMAVGSLVQGRGDRVAAEQLLAVPVRPAT